MSERASNDIYIATFDMLIRPTWIDDKFTDGVSWNAAIEAAALTVDKSETNLTVLIAEDIRKLKK